MTIEAPLSLKSPHWHELQYCYGSAGDIPKLLRQVEDFPNRKYDANEEPWFTLWSSLAHQGEVYTASYAAAEHFALDAMRRPRELWIDRLHIVGSVERCRISGQGPIVPSWLEPCYRRALELTRKSLVSILADTTSKDERTDGVACLMSLAALSGWKDIAHHLDMFPDGPQ